MTDSDKPNDATWDAPVSEGPGGRIGPFRILEQIGEGGFGAVFEAEQDSPVKRRVALKVIKLGMDTREVIARFDAERQALALMDHPHIARVFDAGATSSGRPYFVMELVKGQPMASYCDKHKLSIPDRLRLFEQVCLAVQHAHTKGVIHRDLKPNNVLVSTQDDKPFAKVIDFGIAKATSSRLTDRTLYTGLNQMIGTPLYMSPEQAEGASDIDTRSDVYSLGVMLYELLTGTTPVEPESLKSAVFAELQRIIRDVEPPRPSVRLVQSATTLTGVATQRGVEPRKLTRMVKGDLDWIVMKALEKDRRRRYETANGFAMDVRRYLEGEPVLAAPPSASYQARKFVSRHKSAVAAGSLVVASLLAGILAFAWQARIARARADELQHVAKFQSAMLAQVDPTAAGLLLSKDVRKKYREALAKEGVAGADLAAQDEAFARQWQRVNATDATSGLIDRTILQPAVAAIDRQFQDQPLLAATLRQVVADRYAGIGLYDEAIALQERVVADRRRLLGNDHPDTLASINSLGCILRDQGRLGPAEPLLREALAGRRRVLGADDRATLTSLADLGNLLSVAHKTDEALKLNLEALDGRRRTLGDDDPDTIGSINDVGSTFWRMRRYGEAETYLREALEKNRRVRGEDDPETLSSLGNVGAALEFQGKLDEALPFHTEALARKRRVLGEDHPDTLTAINNMGNILERQRKFTEAEAYFREALDKRVRLLGEDSTQTALSAENLGGLLIAAGKPAEAEAYFRQAMAISRRAAGETSYAAISAELFLCTDLQAQRRIDEAATCLDELIGRGRAALGDGSPLTLVAVKTLGDILLIDRKKPAEVVKLLAPFEAAMKTAFLSNDPDRVASFQLTLGLGHTGTGDYGAAERTLLEGRSTHLLSDTPTKAKDTRNYTQALINLYTAWHAREPGKGFDAKAQEWRSKLDEPSAPKPRAAGAAGERLSELS